MRPAAREEIASPARVQGTARVFEGNVRIVIRDARGGIAGQAVTTASAGAPERGDYSAMVSYQISGGRQEGVVEVFSPSAVDGTPLSLVRVPVFLLPN